MSSGNVLDQSGSYYRTQPRGFLTPPPLASKARRCSPVVPGSEKKPRWSPQAKADLFHVIHKVPAGDSPYVRAKHVQLIGKDPSRAISLFWTAINSGDRVDSALKDMAVVMKQLDRSDEAIEAIKSFRHLCPLESQESLDNILVELYKQSGRIEEEIEMLQLKLKQVEQGIAFGGKRTKIARSQGKKILITVEKEYSRLLGNLAWAYMQKKDFNSAEECYRKALSLEADKNKQCNLAMCLMHLNKLTEAKFLLQAIGASSDNGCIDESHAKSYERASQMLVELEKRSALEPMEQTGHKFGATDCGFGFQKYCDYNKGSGSSPLLFADNKIKKAPFTEFSNGKRAEFGWRRNHYKFSNGQEAADSAHKRAYELPFCNGRIPKVPFTQPRRQCSFTEFSNGFSEKPCGGFCRKLSFEQPTDSEKVQSVVNQNLGYYSSASAMPQMSQKHLPSTGGDWRKNSMDNLDRIDSETVQPSKSNVERTVHLPDCLKAKEISDIGLSDAKEMELQAGYKISTCICNRNWADMVDEDDQELDNRTIVLLPHEFPQKYSGKPSQEPLFSYQTPGRGSTDTKGFNDENVNSNIVSETPASPNQAEKLMQKIESIDLGSGYFTQPEKNVLSMKNESVRRSLCFDQNQKPGTDNSNCVSPLPMKALNFEGPGLVLSEDFTSTKSTKPRQRLQVFQDITCAAASPRP